MTISSNTQRKYLMPETLNLALEYADKYTDRFSYIAGGTDLMVNKYQGNEKSQYLIDLSEIKELQEILVENDFLKIGALVKLNDLKYNDLVKKQFPILIEAAKSVGSPLIRNQATLGGNLLCENRCMFYNQSEFWREAAGFCLKCGGNVCIASGSKKACLSKFVSDTAPALISLDAEVVISGKNGKRNLKLETLYSGDGINSKNIKKEEILEYVVLPLNREFKSSFRKLRQRKTLEYTSLTVAASIDKDGSLKIALSGIAPGPVVISAKHNDKKKELISEAIKKSKIINTDIIPREYRRRMLEIFIEKCLNDIGF